MKKGISHNWNQETPEEKALWFQGLSFEERMEQFCSYTNFILTINPNILEYKNVRPVKGRVRIISKE